MYNYNSLVRQTYDTNRFPKNLYGYIIFFPNEEQEELTNYIKTNLNAIKKEFRTDYKDFILSTDITFENTLPKELKYRYPILNRYEPNKINPIPLKEYFGWKDYIGGGFFIIGKTTEFIVFNYTSVEDFNNFIKDYTKIIFDCDDLPYCPESTEDKNIKLDEDTQEKVNTILQNITALKESGQLLNVLPLIDSFVRKQNKSIEKLSFLLIDDTNDYKFTLPEYGLEIKLSYLSKVIYMLFLMNDEQGILLSELGEYRADLLSLYKRVSNRDDLDKMNKSIDDLIDLSTNAIYVHLSRIKSAFTKVLHPSIAENYYIYGDKLKPKKIDAVKFGFMMGSDKS